MLRKALTNRPVLTVVGLALLVGLAIYLIVFLRATGLFRTLAETRPGPCTSITGVIGPEDIAIDPATGLAFVTHADRDAVAHGRPPMGDILVMDLTAARPALTPLNALPATDFFPHGLDLYVGEDGEKLLFVVNHGRTGDDHSIEIFQIGEAGRLSHRETIRDPAVYSPNDVVAVGPRAFYATNDLGARSAFWRRLEPYLLAPWANVAYFDGRQGRLVLDGQQYPNGIVANADRDTLFVAEVLARKVTAYTRDPATGDLTRAWAADVAMGVDNLIVDRDGAIWAAGHPRPLEFTRYVQDLERPSSSEVVRIDYLGRPAPRTTTVYLDRGQEYSAVSVAAPFGGRLYMGAVYERRMLVCAMDGGSAP